MLRWIPWDTIFRWEHLCLLAEVCRAILKVVGLENILAGVFLLCYTFACLFIAVVLHWTTSSTATNVAATEWTALQLWSRRVLVVLPGAASALLIRYFSKAASHLLHWVLERTIAACQGLRLIRDEGGIHLGASELLWFIFAAVYALSPLDLVPDVFPILGWLDDFGFLYWAGGHAFAFAVRCAEARGRSLDDGTGASTATKTGSDCGVCLDQTEQAALRPCGHRFCRGCAEEVRNRGFTCPLCRAAISGIDVD